MDIHFTAEEHYRRGCELLAQGRTGEAFEYFRTAHSLDTSNARYRSHYGLGLALVERRRKRRRQNPPQKHPLRQRLILR